MGVRRWALDRVAMAGGPVLDTRMKP
ncbi:MAG: hypothetical protein QOC95_2282, partial [Thermoleophilaceae bacterium]|nr:hypothetical protein [Thermoleophilaceae bacterium]